MGTEALNPFDPDTFNPTYHSELDNAVNQQYMSNFARVAVIYIAELAKSNVAAIATKKIGQTPSFSERKTRRI